ncbi:MAG: hypothetical protein QOG10_3470 [Kribbellaceae bacterium]|jgi:hypothetical protein|nr:hypothetical protein [Kribbellaceae bacterium]
MTRTPRRLTRRIIGLGVSTVALTLALAGCGGEQTGSAPPPAAPAAAQDEHTDQHEDGSLANAIVDDRLAGADLRQLTKNSDLVVHGRITAVEAGVPLAKGDPTAKYAVYTIQVRDTVRGKNQREVQLALLSEIEGARIVLEERPNPKVGDDVIALLTKIAPEFNHPGYVLTNQSGLMLVKPDGRVVSGIEGSSPVAAEAKSLRTVSEVLDHLRTAG